MTGTEKENIKKMRKEGQSYSQIALALNINKNTVKAFCRRSRLQTNEKVKTKIKEKEICFVCKNCGKPLKKGTKGQPKKFCCEACRREWWKANDKEINKKAYYTLICTECGIKFESYGNKKRKFCSHACYINNRFKKERNVHESRAI
ncbi:helix-turn-helix transcriptional regulator [Clostridium botulinum]|nr:helix-turn-helix transcriptional regulator [Clostridium botulinum]NFL37813.1 helix-turn-helix transcriptional regulator [Clostridium botulinum]NFL64103.1 helix-turn-helix transcriptional regulator [Clostridium botulinum]NFN07765.1 helix-turn-helix transcriptional regulator [Clostridium botulinum]NFN24000.1 helix-turn-helix transcriptional regulator [Clostridium botulinum]